MLFHDTSYYSTPCSCLKHPETLDMILKPKVGFALSFSDPTLVFTLLKGAARKGNRKFCTFYCVVMELLLNTTLSYPFHKTEKF